MEFTTLFPGGETSVNLPVEITDDEVPLEEVETLIASLRLNNPPSTVQLGSPSMTSIEIVDNDGTCLSVERFGMCVTFSSVKFTHSIII